MKDHVVFSSCGRLLFISEFVGESFTLVGCGKLLEMDHCKFYCIYWWIVKDSIFDIGGFCNPLSPCYY